jgi:hypothetical protein
MVAVAFFACQFWGHPWVEQGWGRLGARGISPEST